LDQILNVEYKGESQMSFSIKGKSKKQIQYELQKAGRTDLVNLHDDHKYLSRRDLLGSGLVGFSGWLMTPSILGILSSPSFANAAGDACGGDATAANPFPAYIAIHLAGGAGLTGNYIVKNSANGFLTDYSKMGLGSGAAIQAAATTEFGTAQFYNQSGLLAGIRAGAPASGQGAEAQALVKTAFLPVCVKSSDDNSNNLMDPSGMILKAGRSGTLLPNLGQDASTGTGIGIKAAKNINPPSPLIAGSVASIKDALAPAKALATLNAKQRTSLFQLVGSLSSVQGRSLASVNSSSSSQTIGKLVECATGKNIGFAGSTGPLVDPSAPEALGADARVAAIFQTSATGAIAGRSQAQRQVIASMVFNTLKGNAASAGINLGGYDYHGQARNATDAKDNDAGMVIGWVLAAAAALGQKVVIHVTSDGSVDAPAGSAIGAGWSSDQGDQGTNFILMYSPEGRPALTTRGAQIGHFTAGGIVDTTTPVGTPENAALAVFLNYMKFAGQLDKAERVVSGLDSSMVDYMVRIAG
jgi:hypothetical protein